MLAALRRARSGYLLARHVLLLGAAGRAPSEIAAGLVCSRSSVSRTGRAYRTGTLGVTCDAEGQWRPPSCTTVRLPTLQRSLLAWRKTAPQPYGWWRTRWSGATLALTLQATRGLTVAAEPMRRWLHEAGWVWPRAKLAAKDDDPRRIER